MRHFFVFCALGGVLTACAGLQPQSLPTHGVGFGSYSERALAQARREAQLTGRSLGAPPQSASGTVKPTPSVEGGISLAELKNAGIGQTGGTAADAGPATGLPLNALKPLGRGAGLSDEQNFSAVSARETIVSDALRRERQAEQLIVVDPVPLPIERAPSTGVNIVEYAINAPNAKGQEWYSRSLFATQARSVRNCADFRSADDAQRAFLNGGGPERDSQGLDPDGDGFACDWDPEVYRSVVGN